MSRTVALLLSALVALAITAVPASAAKPKHKPKRHHRAPRSTATPVAITLLDGSSATVDLGNGLVRSVPLTGTAAGIMPLGYNLNQDNAILLTSARVALGATPLLDDACGTRPVAATSSLSALRLAPPPAQNAILVRRDGTVQAVVGGALRLVLDVRGKDCGAASAPTGWADTAFKVTPAGKLQRESGFSHLVLDSAPQPLPLTACLTPGDPALACAGPVLPLPATLSTHLVVNIKIG
jgi:hypothetical protein